MGQIRFLPQMWGLTKEAGVNSIYLIELLFVASVDKLMIVSLHETAVSAEATQLHAHETDQCFTGWV